MPNGDGGGGFDFGGLFDSLLGDLAAAVAAIIQFLQELVVAIVNALNTLFGVDQAIFGFSFVGSETILRWLKQIWDTIQKTVFGALLKHLYGLFQKLQAFVKKLKAWLDKLHQLQQKYEMKYFRLVIQILSRARKILTIFRFFHLKFAQRLDNWLATVEGRLGHFQILMAQKLNETIAWVNLVVDPRGALRTFPLVAGIIAALNVTWSGIFGVPFQGAGGAGSKVDPSVSVKVTFPQTVADAKTGQGQAAEVHSRFASQQTLFNSAAGL